MDHGSSPGHNPGWAGGHNVSGERYRLSSRDDFPAVHHPPDGGRRVSLRPTHLQGADRESQCHYFPQHHRGLSTVSVMRPIYSHRFVSFRATGEAPSHLGGAAGGGPQPEEEKEEPDSDAEIDDTPKYIRSCLKWFRTVFPVLHPFYWFCGALCFCAMLVLIGLGDGTSPVQKEYMLGVASPGWQPGDTPEATTKPPEVLRDISMQSVLTQGGLAYFYVVCMNMSFWLGFMLLRSATIWGDRDSHRERPRTRRESQRPLRSADVYLSNSGLTTWLRDSSAFMPLDLCCLCMAQFPTYFDQRASAGICLCTIGHSLAQTAAK